MTCYRELLVNAIQTRAGKEFQNEDVQILSLETGWSLQLLWFGICPRIIKTEFFKKSTLDRKLTKNLVKCARSVKKKKKRRK